MRLVYFPQPASWSDLSVCFRVPGMCDPCFCKLERECVRLCVYVHSDVCGCVREPGKPGCDNRFAYELRAAGLRVLNPASSIIALHLHASDIRNYVHGPDTVQGAYAAVVPVRNIT